MKKHLLFLFFSTLLFQSYSHAQIVGTDVFLQGQWLEIGVDKMGAFGTCSSPATYHAHACCGSTTCATSGAAMDASYDWGHDGWATGTPCFMGPYTEPGYPQEGWSIEIAGTEYRNWAGGGLCTGDFAVTGGITGYTNSAGIATGTFTGTAAGVNVVQETRVDTMASWVVVTTRMYNTTASPVTGVYYERTCDPDNSSDWGGTSETENMIVHQNEDDRHEVEVGAYTNTGIFNMYNNWMSLATKDCRAKCGFLSGGLFPSGTPSSLLGGAGGSTTLGDSTAADVAIWLVYNIGTLAPVGTPGDSAVVSYAYIYSGREDIENAFPEPQLVVNDTAVLPTGPAPAPTIDTVKACRAAGVTTIPVEIMNATDKDWTWSTWTWTPAIGLTTTTGTVNTIDITALPTGYTTYTISGTDSAGGMNSCANRMMYLTVFKPLPALITSSNSPVCTGNPLNLTATPDSSGETFAWTGPEGFTSSLASPSITNPTVSQTGTYKVFVNYLNCVDSAFLTIAVDSTPNVAVVNNNTPICSGPTDTLLLTSSDLTAGVSYAWNGPGFTSTLQNPVLPDASVPESGTYTVTATLAYDGINCSSQATTVVQVDSTPYLPLLTTNSPICSGTSLLLTSTSTNLTPAFATIYNWTGPNGFSTIVQNPTITPSTTQATGVYTVTATIVYPGIPMGCISNATTIVAVVDSTPVVPVPVSNSPGPPSICQGDTLILTSTDATAGVSYSWVGPDGFMSLLQNPTPIANVMPAATGVYTLTVSLGMCSSSAVTSVSITPTPILTGTNNGPVCTGTADTLFLQATGEPGATFSWTGPYTFVSNTQNPFRTPVIMEYAGVYQVMSYLNGCPSLPVNDTVVIRQTPKAPWLTWLTYCQNDIVPPLQGYGDSVLWYSGSTPGAEGSLTPPTPSTASDTVMWFFATQTTQSCMSSVDSMKVIVNPKPSVTLNTNSVGVCPHDTTTLIATDNDAITYYHWAPFQYLNDSVGPLVVSRPETDITYTVVVTNKYGCTDTASAAVTVKPGALLTLNSGDSVVLYPGETYQLNPQTNCSRFSWFPPAGLSGSEISNPIASPEISTLYKVTGTTDWGCSASDSLNVWVNIESLLAIPNAFTPGNGPNSTFKIIMRGIATLNYFRIFDRWGNQVYETADINAGWDGAMNGTPQPFGVYIYEVSAVTSTGKPFIKHGNVTLLR